MAFLFIIGSKLSMAAEEPPKPSGILSACQSELEQFCKTIADTQNFRDQFTCLIKNDSKLSLDCKKGLERMIQAREESSGRGGGALTSFGGLNAMGPPLPLFSYEGRYDESIRENKANISIPVYKSGSDSLAVSLAAGQLYLNENLRFDNGMAVPENLSRYEVGAQYHHQLPERRHWGLRTSIGYTGDKAFAAAKDTSYSLIASYGFPSSEKGYWVTMVYMANNSIFLNYVPIPGAMYIYRTKNFSGMFGFPITSMQWTPEDSLWAYSLSMFGPTVQIESAYGLRDKIQYFTNYAFMNQSYIPSERDSDQDRLRLQEQKVAFGLRGPFIKNTLWELQTGYGFQRSFILGKGFFRKERSSVEIPDHWFVSWGIKILL